jgi:ribosomal protein L3 glutamine methyltransferase
VSALVIAQTTVKALVNTAYSHLKKARLTYSHGTTNAWDEAVCLVLHTLQLPLDQLTPFLERKVTPTEQRRVWGLINRRIRHRLPTAYLINEAWLGDYRFYVDRRVIVPRSFIAELLRDKLMPWIAHPKRIKSVLDLGTGSGCLAVLLAKTFPQTHVDAADISRAALTVARRNVAAYRLQRRIRLLQSNIFSGLGKKRYDLILSNPPYVSAAAMRALPREHRHEPKLALAGGRDGFDFVRIILQHASQHLTPNGLLVVEIGHYRKQLEAAFPHLPFVWPLTSGGDDCVFILERRDLSSEELPAAHQAKRVIARSRPR